MSKEEPTELPEVGENQFWRITAAEGSTNRVWVSLYYRQPKKRWWQRKPHEYAIESSKYAAYHWDAAKVAHALWNARGEYFASLDRRAGVLGDYPPETFQPAITTGATK